jgi:16S rRNA G966 N2-methylase RsmD
LLSQCLLLLIERKWVKDEGSIYFENANLLLETEVPAPWKIVKQKKAGAMWYGLIKRQEALPSEIKESEL